ncbi:hypothetical protein EZV62_026437 [Acer yangbiense]|uniref:Gnk2-homologous domain-containing protein n=1 Tax=Acer yangbiense TaxID=1000413 RepID=A0A5C7GRC1_9ROSI|nr:hypothetical protein EZV62_026437 [Acer yangbiense]
MKMKLGLHGFEPGMENRIVWSWVCGFEKGMEKMMGDVGEEDCGVVGFFFDDELFQVFLRQKLIMKMSSLMFSVIFAFLLSLSSSLFAFTGTADPLYIYHTCSEKNFTRNSTYQSNLNRLLSSLSSYANQSKKFNRNTEGEDPNKAYDLFQCCEDPNTSTCQDCVTFASTDAAQRCPSQKEATIWYNECYFRFSDSYIFYAAGLQETYKKGIIMGNTINVTIEEYTSIVTKTWEIHENYSYTYVGCADGNDILTAETLQFDLGTIQAATNRFSTDNKLGAGGFGVVYKVCIILTRCGIGSRVAVEMINLVPKITTWRNNSTSLPSLASDTLEANHFFDDELFQAILKQKLIMKMSSLKFSVIFVFLLSLSSSLFAFTSAVDPLYIYHTCSEKNFTINSTYQSNLNRLLSARNTRT